MRKPFAPAAALVVSLAALAGCTADPSGAATSHKSSSSPSATSTPTPTPTPTAPAGTPLGAGERLWTAFSQRGLSYDAWWAGLRPLLSDSARAVYRYDDPRNIPAMTVTGRIHIAAKAPDRPRYTAEVIVPTSKGRFGLDLERHTLKSRWLLYAIKFPPGVE
jgi:hypothetical protein